MSAVWIQVQRRYGGSPEPGTVLRVEQTGFLDALLREGLVTLLPDPPEQQAGEERDG
ncbi:hypothetical protein [Streptomyces sp. NPDC057302]|uniref:hypothetical protein n=1 Tax=Streptomyces sp. NPDC057302 TaxID=3346094 RepID=UPI0036328F6C